MIDELREEEIVNKVGGRFKLSTLIQKRLVALNAGSRPLVDLETENKLEIVIREIMQDKIYLDASEDERARRRANDSAHTGSQGGHAAVAASIHARDQSDKTRTVSPLTVANDAILIDTTNMPIDVVVERVLDLARERSA